jgi:hypothetical protein
MPRTEKDRLEDAIIDLCRDNGLNYEDYCNTYDVHRLRANLERLQLEYCNEDLQRRL